MRVLVNSTVPSVKYLAFEEVLCSVLTALAESALNSSMIFIPFNSITSLAPS